MGCGLVFGLLFAGLLSIICSIISLDFGLFMMGAAFIGAGFLWLHYINTPTRKSLEAERDQQSKRAKQEKQIAHAEGLDKYYQMNAIERLKYLEGVRTMRELGDTIEKSVYQEKEKDWATRGGIAEGIAGPAAGIIVAANAMLDNERIKEENAARKEWGAKQKALFQDMAKEALRKIPQEISMEELQEKYEIVLSWAPSTLYSLITLSNTKIDKNSETGALIVSTSWQQEDNSICIDGSLRAKIYTDSGEYAGCAYLVFPKVGTVKFQGNLSGICTKHKFADKYTVQIEPVDLWEITFKGNSILRENDNLTDAEHRKIVADNEIAFLTEIGDNSTVNEIKKLRELLEQGIITPEEFDNKKKQLLNL